MAEIKTPYGTVVGLILNPKEKEEAQAPEKPKRPARKAKPNE